MTENIGDARSQLSAVQASRDELTRLMTTILSPEIVAALAGGTPPTSRIEVGSTVAEASAALRSLDAQLLGLRVPTSQH